jgi:hypothetical protein
MIRISMRFCFFRIEEETAHWEWRFKNLREMDKYCMQNFYEWLTHADLLDRLRLIETYFSFDPQQYNQLFRDELEKVIQKTSDPRQRHALEEMSDFDFVGYISASIRRSGAHDQREIQEKTHDLVTKLLVGKLFRGYDETISGPMDRRFKSSVKNAIINQVEKERNRRKFLPSISINQDSSPELSARPSWGNSHHSSVIDDFRKMVRNKLGELGLGVLDARLSGQEMNDLVGNPELGSPSHAVLKRVVREIKQLAREYAESTGDAGFLRQVEKAMGREEETVAKRLLAARNAPQ